MTDALNTQTKPETKTWLAKSCRFGFVQQPLSINSPAAISLRSNQLREKRLFEPSSRELSAILALYGSKLGVSGRG
jgi:hypothetical protein